ncbi:MAG: hypothetical protein ABMB14_35570, partial [Myxococcota bacterium]
MTDPLVGLAMASVATGAVWWLWRRLARADETLNRAIAALRFEGDPDPPSWAGGEVDGTPLVLQVVDAGIELRGPVEARTSAVTFDGEVQWRSPVDPVLGEHAFDAVVRIRTVDELRLLAALDPSTRDAVAAAVRAGARWTGTGWVAVFAREALAVDEVVAAARAIGRAHRCLARSRARPPIAAVVERLQHDRAVGVRRRALAVLLRHNAVTVERVRPSLGDIDPELRITAAEALGAWDVLLEVVRTGTRTWRVRAATTLARVAVPIGPDDRAAVRDVLLAALDDPEVGAVAAEGLGALATPEVLPRLVEVAR